MAQYLRVPIHGTVLTSADSWHSMYMTTLAFLPTSDSINPWAARIQVSKNPFVVSQPREDVRWVTHVCGELASTAEPLILIFDGDSSVHAPAVGFSRKSLRRPAVGYVLIDPVLPAIGGDYGDWPDAPVNVVITQPDTDRARETNLQARLRGWKISQNNVQEILGAY